MMDKKHATLKREYIEVTINFLEQAAADYIQWMTEKDYYPLTRRYYQKVLERFVEFVRNRRYGLNEVFTLHTLNAFITTHKKRYAYTVRGLARFLFAQKRIPEPIPRKAYPLPDIYEAYLVYRQKYHHTPYRQRKRIKRVLAALHDFLTHINQDLHTLKIEQIDAFQTQFNASFAPGTKRLYRYYLRGFLSYLYREKGWLRKDLAPLVIGPPLYTRSKPPKFLRPQEITKVLDHPMGLTALDLRTYAMAHLAYFLGLRPKEITQIRLNHIAFQKAQLDLLDRKNNTSVKLPIPERVLKAIAAYVIGGRPKSKCRRLILSHEVPYGPLSATRVSGDLGVFLRKVNVKATGYWLRHSYAQTLLQAGASLYDIKQMLGHESIEATKQYLHVHLDMMRKVLFNETL